MTCTWCGHPEHVAAACTRTIAARVYRRPAPPADTTKPCPCARRTP